MIYREITPQLIELANQFPAIAIMGPRQSGKTTLAQEVFKDYIYVSMEELDIRRYALSDPRGFLASFEQAKGVIIDEIQQVPELFSYIQGIIDKAYKPGFFILTGSQNFLLHEKISQTLAGRIALLTLLPLSIQELKQADLLPKTLDDCMLHGFYPRTYDQPINYQTWFNNYISTYVEKDVRDVLKISDVATFQRFIRVCAARIGSLLNYADIARDCDISLNTAKAWISILESSYIIKLLQPYYKSYNKRLIKTPKLYFYDTGIACALLGIRSSQELNINPMRGHLFESLMMSELFKYNFNHNLVQNLYFWRDVQGHEIDCILEKSYDKIIPIELKSSMTISPDFFKGLASWNKITQQEVHSYVLYGGNDYRARQSEEIFSWREVNKLLDKIYQSY